MTLVMQTATANLIWGVGVPALIFLIAFVVTWLLYRHFSERA